MDSLLHISPALIFTQLILNILEKREIYFTQEARYLNLYKTESKFGLLVLEFRIQVCEKRKVYQ